MKICSVILTYNTPLYNSFDSYKRNYFTKLKLDHDFVFVHNSSNPSYHDIDNNTYNFQCNYPYHPSGIPSMFNKFIHIIKSGILDQYDFVIRSNSSTFVNIPLVFEHLLSKENNIYMGFFEQDWDFVSGACTIFSKDVLKKLADNCHLVNSFREDDVVIGSIMKMLNVDKTFLDRYCFEDFHPHNPNDITIPSITEIQEALKKPQIRIRNDSNRNVKDIGIWSIIDQIT